MALFSVLVSTRDRPGKCAAVLHKRSSLALKATGFAEPRVMVKVEQYGDGKEVIVIDAIEGARTMQGPIRVTGLPDEMAARLAAYLQAEQVPIYAEVEKFSSIAGFFQELGYFEVAGVPGDDLAQRIATVRKHVDVSVRCADGQATLVIDVRPLPAPSVLKDIELGDTVGTTTDELRLFLGITIGQTVTTADRATWLAKLRDSGRFVSHEVSFKLVPGGVAARFDVVKYARGKPLGEPRSSNEQAVRKFREWLLGQLYAGHNIHVRAVRNHDGAKPVEMDMVIGRDAGIVVAILAPRQ